MMRHISVERLAKVLPHLCFIAFFATRTSFPFLLDGIPLATRPEFGVLLLYFFVVMWLQIARWSHIRFDQAWLPDKIRTLIKKVWPALSWTLVGVFVLLTAIKISFPSDAAWKTCVIIPEVSDKCSFSPDTAFGRAEGLTRYESIMETNRWTEGDAFRLAEFNTLIFNVYRPPEGTPAKERENFRNNGSYPLAIKFSPMPRLVEALSAPHLNYDLQRIPMVITARGQVQLVGNGERKTLFQNFDSPYTQEVIVSRQQLTNGTLIYTNHECENSDCSKTWKMKNLVKHRDINLRIELQVPGDPPKLIGFDHRSLLILQHPTMISLVRGLERVSIYLFLLMVAAPLISFVLPILSTLRLYLKIPAFYAGTLLTYGLSTLIRNDAFWIGIPLAMVWMPLVSRQKSQSWTDSEHVDRFIGIVLPAIASAVYAAIVFFSLHHFDTLKNAHVGDDNLTYSSWGLDILRNMSFFTEYTTMFSKPLFLYWRSLWFVVLGDGTEYLSALTRVSLMASGFFMLGALARRMLVHNAAQKNIGAVPLVVLVAVAFMKIYFDWAINFSSDLFSEGPAWFLLSIVCGLILTPPDGNHLPSSRFAVLGFLCGIMCMFRVNFSLYLPIILATCALQGWPMRRTQVVAFATPVFLCFGIVLLHGVLFGAESIKGVMTYIGYNTTLKPTGNASSVFSSDTWPRLMSNDDVRWGVCFSGILLMGAFSNLRGRAFGLAAVAVAIFAICGVILQVPQVVTGYYPRTIVGSYWCALPLLVSLYSPRLHRA